MNVDAVRPAGRGRGGGRGAPFGNAGAKKELRRPMNAVSPVPPKSDTSDSTEDDIAMQVKQLDINSSEGQFNVHAQEFVPKSSLNATASEFVPSFAMPSVAQDDYQEFQEEPAESQSVNILYDAMYQLTMEPGRFDSIARKLTEDLNVVIKDFATMENLAEIILENGITEPNFRYTGARLCDYLSCHLTKMIEGATLRQILMQKCNREFKEREKMLSENQDRLRGFVLFLAELFQQLEIQVDAVVQRVHVLGDAIPQLILTLGSDPSKENVKCMVQTLKCCGSVLEEEERSKQASNGQTPVLDKTFLFLSELSCNPELEQSLREMLASLVKLRNNNWGHSPPSATPTQTELPGVGTYQLDPVFYAPDGQVLTMEEYNFINELEADEDYFGEVQWSTGEDIPGGGMGDEMDDAYEEFLRGQS